MKRKDFPAPEKDFVITHFLTISDFDRSRKFYSEILGGQVVKESEPCIIKIANTWITLNVGGGPTEDKPDVTLKTPDDLNNVSSFLNFRVADVQKVYKDWSAKGARFLTPPVDHGMEIRCYLRDPDNHLIEVGQATEILKFLED